MALQRHRSLPWLLAAGLLFHASVAWGQTGAWSELRLQYELWQAARRAQQRAEQLEAQGLLATSELERARTEALTAEMRFRMLLERWCYDPPLRLADAVLTALPTEGWQLRLTWVNESPDPEAGEVAGLLWQECRGMDARAVIRVTDEQGRSIGFPPEQSLAPWAGRSAQAVTFELARPLSVVYVVRRTLGQERRDGVSVRVAGSTYRMETPTPSQVVPLGTEVRYPLTIRGVPGSGACVLAVEGLPSGVNAQFYDPETNAVLRAVEAKSDTLTRTVELRLTLPETWDPGALDRPLQFRTGCRRSAVLDPALTLELTPTGRPFVDIAVENYWGQVRVGGSLDFHLLLQNRGYRGAQDVRLEAEAPARWVLQWSPPMPWAVPPQERVPVTLRLQIPEDAVPGEYVLRFRLMVPYTPSVGPREEVELRVRLLGRSGPGLWPAMLGAVLFLGGAVVGVWRLMRRY